MSLASPHRYVVAVGACFAALILKLALGPNIAPGAFITFYGAVVFSAWYGGSGPGLFATGLSLLIGSYLFLPWWSASGVVDTMTLFRALLFSGIAGALSSIIGGLESVRHRVAVAEQRYRHLVEQLEVRVAERTAELSKANQRLQGEVTARQQTADALRGSEQRFASAFAHASIGMVLFRLGESPVVVEANRAFREMLGYGEDEAMTAEGMRLILPEDLEAARVDMQRLLVGEIESYHTDRRFLHRQGQPVWAQVSVSAVRADDGTPIYLIAQLQDITVRKQAEEVLRSSEASYRNLVQNISDGIFVVDHDGLLTFISPAIEVVSGYLSAEVAGRCFTEFVHPDDRDIAWKAFQRAMSHRIEATEYRLRTRFDTTRWVRVTASPIVQGDRRTGMRGLVMDITEAKEVAAAVAEGEKRFAAITETISDIVVLLDANATLRYVGPSVSRILGYRSEDLVGRVGFEIIHEDDHERMRSVLAEHLRCPGQTLTTEYRCWHSDGSLRWLESISTNRLDDPFVAALVVTARDITERKRIEHDLRQSELKFRTLAETAAAGIFIYQDKRLRYVNPAGMVLTGFSQDELLAMDLWDLVDPKFRDAARERGEARLRGASVAPRAMVRLVGKGGVKRWVEFTAARIDYNDAPAILGTAFDVTDRKQAEKEARARQAELAHVLRLRTMGEMASGMAHEVNQPLQAVINYARGCVRHLRTEHNGVSDLREPLEQIAHEAMRAGEIVRRIRQFVRKGELKREWANLNDLVREAVRMVEADAIRDGIAMELCVGPDLPHVLVDVVQIEQVVLNLVRNALEAMPPSKPGPRTLRIETSMPDASSVEVRVQDSGDGFPPERAEDVFAPFYTTKSTGMGMGLSISRSIVSAHGGTMWARSTPGHGATFGFSMSVNGVGAHNDP